MKNTIKLVTLGLLVLAGAQKAQAYEDDTIWGGDIGDVYCYAKGPAPKPVTPPSDYMLNPNWNKPGTIPGNGEPQTQPGNGYNNPNPPESNKESDPCKGIPVCARCGGIERTTPGSQSMAKSVPSHGPTCTKAECKCKKDCAGVPNGKAYINECKECIDGNKGKFDDSKIPGAFQEQFRQVIKQMESNCMDAILLNSINNNSGIDVETYLQNDDKSPGTYYPCEHKIRLNLFKGINQRTIREEFFHAYQEQHYKGKVNSILSNLNNNDYKGGCNIEFEAKAMRIYSMMQNGEDFMPEKDEEPLFYWMHEFFSNHGNAAKPVVLSTKELGEWYKAMEAFQAAHKGEPNLYGKPIDKNMKPDAWLNLINQSPCPIEDKTAVVVTPKK